MTTQRSVQDAADGASRIGVAILRLRMARGWSQRRLAREAGVSQSTVSQMENGRVPPASIEVLARLLVAMDSGDGLWVEMS